MKKYLKNISNLEVSYKDSNNIWAKIKGAVSKNERN